MGEAKVKKLTIESNILQGDVLDKRPLGTKVAELGVENRRCQSKLNDANAETIVYRDRAEIMVEELKAAELKRRNAEARVDVLEDELVASRSQLQALEADVTESERTIKKL